MSGKIERAFSMGLSFYYLSVVKSFTEYDASFKGFIGLFIFLEGLFGFFLCVAS